MAAEVKTVGKIMCKLLQMDLVPKHATAWFWPVHFVKTVIAVTKWCVQKSYWHLLAGRRARVSLSFICPNSFFYKEAVESFGWQGKVVNLTCLFSCIDFYSAPPDLWQAQYLSKDSCPLLCGKNLFRLSLHAYNFRYKIWSLSYRK